MLLGSLSGDCLAVDRAELGNRPKVRDEWHRPRAKSRLLTAP